VIIVKGKIVSLAIFLLMVFGSFGAVASQINVEEDLDNEPLGPLVGSRKALLVGVADYPGWGSDLNYPDDDARDMRYTLLDGGWSDSDITMYIDDEGTESAIKTKLNSIASQTTTDSISLFFFSGHGTQDWSGEAICCYDSDMYDSELNDILDNFNGKVVCIIDTCHAGGMGPDSGHEEINTTEFILNFIETLGAGNENRVILMACAADESSWEDPALQNGIFTYFVVEGLEGPADENNDNTITAEETFDYAAPKTKAYEPRQNPQLYDGYPSKDVPIIGEGSGSDPVLGKGIVMANGNEEESYAKATCYSLDDIEAKSGETVTFIIEYHLDCWGWFDEGRVTATVNGDTKTKYTKSNEEGFWSWDISCQPGKKVEWTIESWCKDDNPLFPAWEKSDECSSYLYFEAIGNVDCSGSIDGGSTHPGERVQGTFTVKNVGTSGTKLDWKVTEHPDWGSSWSFSPSSGDNLPGGSTKDVTVTFYTPEDRESFSGSIKVSNLDDSSDYDTVSVYLTVAKNREIDSSPFYNFLQNHPNLFLMLQLLLLRLR
jgi:hypothetical protein